MDLHLRGSALLLPLAAQNGQLEEEQKAWHEQITIEVQVYRAFASWQLRCIYELRVCIMTTCA